jgi:hypothetical protein
MRCGSDRARLVFLNDAEAAAATETNRAQIGRAWDLWKAQAIGSAH